MRRPWNGAMPVTLTLPLGLERRPRVRRQRRRRLAVGALIALAAVLLAAAFWLPARAELAQRLLNRTWQRATVVEAFAPRPVDGGAASGSRSVTLIGGDRDPRRLATLAVGDELTLRRPDGSIQAYEVAALDVVDREHTEFAHADESVVVLVTSWPFGAEAVGGSWRYVVTARRRF
jgi:sortase A